VLGQLVLGGSTVVGRDRQLAVIGGSTVPGGSWP
jgi:hypothetical protein